MKHFVFLFLSLCVHAVSADKAPSQLVTGLIGGEVTLPCAHAAKDGRWPPSTRLYWQDPSETVVYAYFYGQTQSEYHGAKYKGRVMAFENEIRDGNLSLQINNLSAHDDNNYTCYFFVDDKMMYQSLIWLQIAAHSSRPAIQSQDVRLGKEVILTCQSTGGFPKPVLKWTDAGGNSLPIGSQVNTSAQSDPSSGLWNVTSILRVNVTNNSTFQCSVFNSRTQEQQDSDVWAYIPSKPKPMSSQPPYLVSLYVGIAVLICLLVVIIIIVLVKKHNKYTGVAIEDGKMEEIQIHNIATAENL